MSKHTPGPWAVFNVGCIECGVSSNVVGFFATEAQANAVATSCDELLSWREGGQNAFITFDIRLPAAEEYVEPIAIGLSKATESTP